MFPIQQVVQYYDHLYKRRCCKNGCCWDPPVNSNPTVLREDHVLDYALSHMPGGNHTNDDGNAMYSQQQTTTTTWLLLGPSCHL